MSTAALSAPHLEITAPDTMDLHSDSGLDFGDGDIDLDLHSTGGLDDDVSLRDAATDADLDIQTVSGNQDDFMADNEDLIEEDIVDEDVEIGFHPHSTEHSPVLDQSQPADPDDDLIDYSDDEDAALNVTPIITDAHADTTSDDIVTVGNGEGNPVVDEPSRSGYQPRENETASQHASDVYEDQADSAPVQEHDSYTTQQPAEEFTSQDRDQEGNDVHGNPEISVKDVHSPERRTSNPAIVSETVAASEDPLIEQVGQEMPEGNFHPVNVHFNGHDYWLFKHHDYEDSGYYLLEDDSILKQPLHAVISECRKAFAVYEVDIPNDLELGFRFDSLHNVELYEEHTTSAFFTLDHIVGVYLQLQAQDGITDPDYFYVTLLSRPRVSSLLSALFTAATEGMGFSALTNAIASGQTAFSAQYPDNANGENYNEWEEGDEEETPEVQSNIQAGEQEGHDEEYHEHLEREELNVPREDDEDSKEEYQEENNAQAPKNAADRPEETATTAVAASEDVFAGNVTMSANKPAEQSTSNTVASDQSPQDPQDDLLDYSDGEFDNEAPGDPAEATRASSTSATVQGDDLPEAQGNFENIEQDDQQDEQGDGVEEATHDGQTALGDESFAEYEGHDYSYGEYDGQAYEEAFDGEYGQDYSEGQELEGSLAYDATEADDKNTNHLGDLGQRHADHAGNHDVTTESNVGGVDAVEDPSERPNDFVDFDDTATAAQPLVNDHTAEDEIDYSDEEDGVVSQAPVAASAAADTVATSSSGLENLSPQGQKRTIDEVGNDVVDATNLTDAKRPRV